VPGGAHGFAGVGVMLSQLKAALHMNFCATYELPASKSRSAAVVAVILVVLCTLTCAAAVCICHGALLCIKSVCLGMYNNV
jgi:hypothetical protein